MQPTDRSAQGLLPTKGYSLPWAEERFTQFIWYPQTTFRQCCRKRGSSLEGACYGIREKCKSWGWVQATFSLNTLLLNFKFFFAFTITYQLSIFFFTAAAAFSGEPVSQSFLTLALLRAGVKESIFAWTAASIFSLTPGALCPGISGL